MNRHRPLVVVVGPTAVGKTEISIRVAERLEPPGEIVSADSRTFYHGMDVGTAKPTPEDRARVPHHLIDVTTPDRPWSLADFQAAAIVAIEGIHARGHLPLMVGGTGQYVRAIVEGWKVPRLPADESLRAELEAFARLRGHEALHDRLRRLDPVAGAKIDPRNVRRVIRALEVSQATGRGISAQQSKAGTAYSPLILGLTRPRDELYRRVDARIEAMIAGGLVQEVKRLMAQGHDWRLPAMSAVGYKQVAQYLRGEIGLDEAIRQMKRITRSFIRHQANWFKPDDPRIEWFAVDETTADRLVSRIRDWLAGSAGSRSSGCD